MKHIILSFLLLSSMSIFGQSNLERLKIQVSSSQATYLGESPKVKDIRSRRGPRYTKAQFKKDRKVPDNFKGRRGQSLTTIPELAHLGPDPIRQLQVQNGETIRPFVNRDGLGGFNSPHDPTGDVGQRYYIQAINVTQVGIFDKSGTLLRQFAMQDLWQDLGATSAGDPIVLYDEIDKRWIITEFTDPANLLIAVSTTSDPFGSYFAYSFSTPEFPDYPKYAIWGDFLVVTTNEEGPGALHQYFLDKPALIAGDPTVRIQRVAIPGNENTEAGFYVTTPVDFDGTQLPMDGRPIAMKMDDSSWGETTQDEIDLVLFDINWDDPDATQVESISIPTTNFDGYPCSVTGFGFQCVPQQGGDGLDAIPEVIMNIPKFRSFDTHESIVLSFVTDVTDGENLSGIRWMELRKTEAEDWSLYQEGTYSPDSLDRYMSSIAMDKFGNIGLGYNVSSEDEFVGIRMTGRKAGDPLGQMTLSETVIVEGTNPIFANGRFGDYAHMSVDPSNGLSFWYTSEYGGGGGTSSATRIVAFEIGTDTFDLRAERIISPTTSASLTDAETVSMEITNTGLEAISGYTAGFIFEGNVVDTQTFSEALQPDSSIIVTFTNTIDLSAKGTYAIQAFVAAETDDNRLNDTTETTILHLFDVNASLTDRTVITEVCSETANVEVRIRNEGFSAIESGEFQVNINGENVDTVGWIGSLAFGETANATIPVGPLAAGNNVVTIVFQNVNGGVDEEPSDNFVQLALSFSEDLEEFTVVVITDDFPEETFWQITDQDNELVATGGTYDGLFFQTITTPICLNDDGCYIFQMFDRFGDGITNGQYFILNAAGDTVLNQFGDFGIQRASIFCTDDSKCDLRASYFAIFDVEDGLSDVSIRPEGGIPPYEYSIDGGMNFQDDSTFTDLEAQNYDVVVRDSTGTCLFEDQLRLAGVTPIEDLEEQGYVFDVKPNPNDGYFRIDFQKEGLLAASVNIEVMDIRGRIIQSRRMSRYNGVFTTPVSLLNYPKGLYFIRISGEDFSWTRKVLTQ